MDSRTRERIDALSDRGLDLFIEHLRRDIDTIHRLDGPDAQPLVQLPMALCQALAVREMRAAQLQLPV
jgi:hypothetical protein